MYRLIASEVLSRKEYDGKIADVRSCGVTLCHVGRINTNYAESERDQLSQRVEDILWIIQEARTPAQGASVGDKKLLEFYPFFRRRKKKQLSLSLFMLSF